MLYLKVDMATAMGMDTVMVQRRSKTIRGIVMRMSMKEDIRIMDTRFRNRKRLMVITSTVLIAILKIRAL